MTSKFVHYNNIVFGVTAIIKALLLLFISSEYQLQRDEYLYLALGKHLDWGYWSNPPFIGAVSFVAQQLFGTSATGVHVFTMLSSLVIIWLAIQTAHHAGGGRFAVTVTALTVLLCPPYLRISVMFQPVVFDVMFWTLALYCLLRYSQTPSNKWLYAFGVSMGLGMLCKYSVLVLGASVAAGLLLTQHRKLFLSKHLYIAVVIALLVWMPNLIWQIVNRFPAFNHIQRLNAEQLVNVSPVAFVADQFLMHLPAIFLIPLGLWALFRYSNNRMVGYSIVISIVLFLVMKGKSYYTLGVFPVLLALAAVHLEKITTNKTIWRSISVTFIVAISLFIAPFSMPLLSPDSMKSYSQGFVKTTGVDGPLRWEDGKVHDLPQDYADMLGWQQLADVVYSAWTNIEDKKQVVVYAENYGQAAVIEFYNTPRGLNQVLCFADSYLLWSPDTLDRNVNTLIYVNDEAGSDIQQLFARIDTAGQITNPYAREHGTTVFICTQPRQSLSEFWKQQIKEEKTSQ